MNEELEHDLVSRYPSFFKEVGMEPEQSCMAFGMAVDDGWYSIIEEMCRDLDAVVHGTKADITFEQIKEKFGTLRVYYVTHNASDKMQEKITGIIMNAEYRSGITCEICGSHGKVVGPGWLKCLCPTHDQSRQVEKNR